MRTTTLLGLMVALAPAAPGGSQALRDPVPAPAQGAPGGSVRIERFGGKHPLEIPTAETLRFGVRVRLGVRMDVGTVVLSTGVEPYRESLLLLSAVDEQEDGRATVWMRAHAEGGTPFFTLDAVVEARIHPVDWPWIVHRYTRSGTKKRRREVLLGWRGGEPIARYRRDTTTGAPKGTRIWKEARERILPVEALDMITAIYFARAMVREDLTTMRLPLVDKLDLWQLELGRGERRELETPAGTFEAIEVLLEPRPHPGEQVDPKKRRTFEGLFGLHGAIHVWVEAGTGVPIRIQGTLPLGPLDLGVDALLEAFSGTPPGFRPR